jgi:hypothetical protein
MKLKWLTVALMLMVLFTFIYWLRAGHDLRYTINGGEYDEDFSTRGRVIISCLVGAFWSAITVLLLALGRRAYGANTQKRRLHHDTPA